MAMTMKVTGKLYRVVEMMHGLKCRQSCI